MHPQSHMELPERLFQAIKSKPVAAVPEHVTAFKKRKTDAGRQRRERERQRRAAEGRDEEGVEDDEDVDDDEGGSEEEDGEGGLLVRAGEAKGTLWVRGSGAVEGGVLDMAPWYGRQ